MDSLEPLQLTLRRKKCTRNFPGFKFVGFRDIGSRGRITIYVPQSVQHHKQIAVNGVLRILYYGIIIYFTKTAPTYSQVAPSCCGSSLVSVPLCRTIRAHSHSGSSTSVPSQTAYHYTQGTSISATATSTRCAFFLIPKPKTTHTFPRPSAPINKSPD